MQKTTHFDPTKNNSVRVFKLTKSDIFSISMKTYMKSSYLWNGNFKIMGFKKERVCLYWHYHRIPTPFKRQMVRLMYMKESNEAGLWSLDELNLEEKEEVESYGVN